MHNNELQQFNDDTHEKHRIFYTHCVYNISLHNIKFKVNGTIVEFITGNQTIVQLTDNRVCIYFKRHYCLLL